jgi:preprotein translocase subunit SecB
MSATEPQKTPALGVVAQYVKDLSFESPYAPRSLIFADKPPQISINIDVQARDMSENNYEVTLRITATAIPIDAAQTANDNGQPAPSFVVELAYAGLFQITDVRPDLLRPVLLIEAPRLLFPFARQILADTARNGGFPPLMLNPIDFTELYRRQLADGNIATGS